MALLRSSLFSSFVVYSLFLLLVFYTSCTSTSNERRGKKIQVHLVPHSHDDTGWLKTVDQYYYGAHNEIQHAAVRYILYTVVQELQNNPNRTFNWVEMAFFSRWWKEQNNATRAIIRKLVTETHQLEFINAGWCMNDEAATDYNAIIDQMSIGLRFVEENFGPSARPRVAWHIDPFGHSAQMATIHALLGMDGFFFFRIDYADHEKRLEYKTMEMIWRGSKSLGEPAEIFTGVLYEGYGPPMGFCFDLQCKSVVPIQDDPELEGYNVDERVDAFVDAVTTQNGYYDTGHVMLTMGSDFQYESAVENYQNLDKLITYVNAKSDEVEVFYSTPSRYLDALNKVNKTWTLKTDDFFPYADNLFSYWTGYYTSRPGLKGYIRTMNSLLQSCKQLEVLGENLGVHDHSNFTSTKLKLAMALNQHHDAVTGTERQLVADDYAKRLHIGQMQCQGLMNDFLTRYLSSYNNATPPSFQFCEYLNISVCLATESNNFVVMVHNPIARATTRMLHFPVNALEFEVLDYKSQPVLSQVIPVSSSTESVRRSRGNATHDLCWSARLPGLGGAMFFIRQTNNGSSTSTLSETFIPEGKEDFIIENEALVLTFSGLSGRLKSMQNKLRNISASVDHNLLWWKANGASSGQASGAYIFNPDGLLPHEISLLSFVNTSVVKGDLVQEVRQQWSPWAYQTVKLYKDLPFAVFEYTIGPIPDGDQVGKEIVSRFTTDLKTNATWYTDANGREMQKRIRNYRPTWNWDNIEPVAGNYYPVDSRIYLRDEDRGVQFTVLTDRAQGGSSLIDGQLELMVHRRLFEDDQRGLKEPLNEPGQFGDGLITRGCHYVILDTFTHSTFYHRLLGEELLLGTQSFITPYAGQSSNWTTKFPTAYYGIVKDLPPNVHLLTLERLDHTHHLLRLEHQAQSDELPLNNTVTVQLEDLFTSMKVVDAVELALGGNAALSDIHRLHWNTETTTKHGDSSKAEEKRATEKRVAAKQPVVMKPPYDIELKPMEIRTFNITVEYL